LVYEKDEELVVRRHVAWALGQIRTDEVREEIEEAITQATEKAICDIPFSG